MKKKNLLILLVTSFLCGCNNTKYDNIYVHMTDGYFAGDEYVLPMNTFSNLRMYNNDQLNEVKGEFDNILKSLSKEVDRYYNYEGINNLKTINDSCGTNKAIEVSDSLYEIIELGVKLTKLSEGKFNLAMGGIIDLYSPLFVEEETTYNSLPEEEVLQSYVSNIPSYEVIDEIIILDNENKTVTLNQFNDNNVIISLGALAKGFIMQKAYDYLKTFNYPALYDAGSSTMGSIGFNPMSNDENWTIALSNPVINVSNPEYLSTFKLTGDNFLSSSGDYQKHFIYKDENNVEQLMHHIIDPRSGISNDFIRSVTLVSNDCSLAVLDALSTALFNVDTQQEFEKLLTTFEEEFSCEYAYLYTTQFAQGNFKEVNVFLNDKFNDMITSKYSDNVKNIKVV